jgi:uncharacterized protein (TIGR02246 family)
MVSLRVLFISAMTVCLAVAASAQEASQSVLTAVSTTNADFIQHWNKQDPAAIAELFTPNVLFVAPAGTYVGQPGVQRYYETIFNTVHPSADFSHDIDHVETLSSDLALAVGHWNLSRPAMKGFWSAIYERRGGAAWVMRSHTYNIMPPAPAAQGTSTPSH